MSGQDRELGDDRQISALRGRVRKLEAQVKKLSGRVESWADVDKISEVAPSQEVIAEAVQAELGRMVAAAEAREAAAAQAEEELVFELTSERRARGET
jgi:cell division protein FtsB